MKGGISRRLETLEEWTRRQTPKPFSAEARRRMSAHLDSLAALRRGELSEEEAAEVEATHVAIEGRMREIRGGGGASYGAV